MRRLPLILALALALTACAKKAAGPLPNDMSLGSPSAKVTVVEYASVGCPVCGHWAREVWPAFKAKYVDTGRVRFTYREMLVGGQSEISLAAAGFLLARCSGPKYFNVIDAIYNQQDAAFADPRTVLSNIAKSIGMSEPDFDKCISDEASLLALNKRVQQNSEEGHVSATPTFVVNGQALEPGFHPLTDLDAAIAASANKPK